METKNYKELPFNLDTAMEHPDWIYTRDGYKCRILATDRKDANGFSLVFAEMSNSGQEIIHWLPITGCRNVNNPSHDDLVLHKPRTLKFRGIRMMSNKLY